MRIAELNSAFGYLRFQPLMLLPRTYLLILLAILCAVDVWADDHEPVEGEPVFFASELVEGLPLKTDFYTVSPLVDVRNFGYEFRVRSKHGSFQARGVPRLKELLRELEAIDKLAGVSQSEAFASSLTDSFSEPVATTIGVARRPVESVTGLPSGVVRYLGGKIYQVKRGSGKAMEKVRDFRSKEKEEEEVAAKEKKKRRWGQSAGKLSRKHLGHDSSKRKWARQLGVDPYSGNEALQDALGRIAWASTLGGFAGDFVVPSSEVFSYAGKARELVWNRPAHQLEREVVNLLKKSGASQDLVFAFRDSSSYSLTEKLELCLAFQAFSAEGAANFLVEYALRSESEEDSSLFLDTVEVLALYNRDVAEIVSLGEKRGMIYACSKNGYEIYPLAVDYLHWTPLVYEALLSDELKSPLREIWVSGRVSPIAKLRLRHHDWQVFDQVGE